MTQFMFQTSQPSWNKNINISSQLEIILKRESVLVGKKVVACIGKDRSENKNQKTGKKRGVGIKTREKHAGT